MERTAPAVRRMVDEMIMRCLEAGMNVTPQRIAIYETLVKSEEHPTLEMLFKRVKRSMPSLSLWPPSTSRSTCWRNLGLVQAVEIDGDSRRYDANMSRHHHLVCTGAGPSLISTTKARSREAVAYDTRLHPHTITVRVLGLCAACAKPRR